MTAPERRPLAAPGAGLPPWERTLLHAGLALAATVRSRRWASVRFRTETRRLLDLVGTLPEARAATPVLIGRVAGIEDSSREWSAYMVLDHLCITNAWVGSCIEAACAGAAVPARGIADMKPDPAAGPDTVDRFRASGLGYLRRVNALPRPRSRGRVAHPWFGPLDAHGWHVLAALHHSIHRRQAQRIVAALP